MSVPAAVGRVLPTLNEDGSRRWIRPKPSRGGYWQARRAVAYVLMVVFILIPHIRMGGKPLILLDLPRRQFTLFGTTFLPTDTLLLMTVYMEFLFRPIERWIEGGRSGSLALDRERQHFHPRRLLKYAIYVVLALILAHTFLAYFVGTEALAQWVRRSPAEHPTSFLVMAGTAVAVFGNFTYFREQTCLVACPYGRMQSVLLDKQSLIVTYDPNRGEPRMKGKTRPEGAGDCIDCGACVLTCPTGIDIRDGLQMECIHCTQCADACDDVMTRIGKPKGLIRYSSRELLEGHQRHIIRPRTVLYPLALVAFLGAFVYALGTRAAADVTVLRGTGEPFTRQDDGRIANQVRVKIWNRTNDDHDYRIEVGGATDGTVIIPQNPLRVEAGVSAVTTLFVLLPATSFENGEHRVTVQVSDGAGFATDIPYRLVGPQGDARGPLPPKGP